MSPSLASVRQSLERLFQHPPVVQLVMELGLLVLHRAQQANAMHAAPAPLGVSTMRQTTPSASRQPATPLLFPLGHIVATPPALSVLQTHGIQPVTLLQRHVIGDWGDLDPEDVQANTDALAHGWRLFSSYAIADGVKVWIITEADRSVTTLLMPDDY